MSATLCDQLIERGVAELQAERYAQAARTLAEARELAPNDAEILSLLGLALMRSGQTAEAGPLLARAVELEPAEPGFTMNLAEWQAANGQMEMAIAGLRTVAEREPPRPRAWERLGDMLLKSGDGPAAARAYDRMLQLDPRNPAGPAKICTALIAARDWGGLADIAQAWSTVAPESADAWRSRSRAAWEQGKFQSALEHYERVLALRPGNVAELCTAARICLQSQDFARAEAFLTEAHARAPGHPEVLAATGMLRICQGRFEEAEGDLLESLAVAPGNIPAYTLLGRLRGERSTGTSGRPPSMRNSRRNGGLQPALRSAMRCTHAVNTRRRSQHGRRRMRSPANETLQRASATSASTWRRASTASSTPGKTRPPLSTCLRQTGRGRSSWWACRARAPRWSRRYSRRTPRWRQAASGR